MNNQILIVIILVKMINNIKMIHFKMVQIKMIQKFGDLNVVVH